MCTYSVFRWCAVGAPRWHGDIHGGAGMSGTCGQTLSVVWLLIVKGQVVWSLGWVWVGRRSKVILQFLPKNGGLGEMILLYKARHIMEFRFTRGGRNLAGAFKFWSFRYHKWHFCTSQIWCKQLIFHTLDIVLLTVSFCSQGRCSITTRSEGISTP